MTPLLLLLPTLAHADLIAPPPDDKQFIVHEVYLDNVGAYPDLVFVAADDGDAIRSPRTFTAEAPTQELGRGHGRGSRGLSRPRIRAVAKADHEAWRARARAAGEAQREACFERGEGCVHPSRFEARYPPLDKGIPCSEPIDVQTTAPRGAPAVRTDAFRVVRADATECVLEAIPVPPPAPEPEPAAPEAPATATSGAAAPSAPPASSGDPAGGCSTAGAWTSVGSLVGGLSLLLLVGRRRA